MKCFSRFLAIIIFFLSLPVAAFQKTDCEYAFDVFLKTLPLLEQAVDKYGNKVDYQDFAQWRVFTEQVERSKLDEEFRSRQYPFDEANFPIFNSMYFGYFVQSSLLFESLYSVLRHGDAFKESVSLQWGQMREVGQYFAENCPEQAARK